MGIASIPAPSAGGGISSVQRGSAGASGNVTITAVNIAKSFVTIFGSASSGTVVPSFGLSDSNFTLVGLGAGYANTNNAYFGPGSGLATGNVGNGLANAGFQINRTITQGAVNAGSNNLVAAQVTGFLANSTTLTVSGACRYEVVEFA